MTPVSVADAMKKGECRFDLARSPFVMFVFPVHSWGPAVTMLKFVERMELEGIEGKPVYAVCTCGDDCGRTDEVFAASLAARGMKLTRCFSVTMPNCYILLPLFDIDSKELEQRKLENAPAELEEIAPLLGQALRPVPRLHPPLPRKSHRVRHHHRQEGALPQPVNILGFRYNKTWNFGIFYLLLLKIIFQHGCLPCTDMVL